MAAGLVSGECHSSQLFSYSGTGENDYTLVSFENLKTWVDADLKRVQVTTGQDSYKYSDWNLLILTDAGNEAFTLSINDITYTGTKSADTTLPAKSITLQTTDLTQPGGVYSLNFKYEHSAAAFLFTKYNTLSLNMLCDSQTTSTINLHDYNVTNITLGSTEVPRFRLTYDNGVREHQGSSLTQTINYYVPENDTSLLYVDYQLQDYTGDYKESILHLQRAFSNVYEDIDSRQWDSVGQIKGVYLYPNIYYRATVTTDTSTQDKGLIIYDANGTQSIRMTEPLIIYGSSARDGLTLSTWQNLTTKRAYCYYLVDDAYSMGTATFTTYNASVIPPSLIYSTTNTTTKEGTFSWEAPDSNLTYKVSCQVCYQLGCVEQTDLYGFNNVTRFMNPTWTHEVMGFSVTEIFSGFGMLLIIFLFGLASAVNGSYIAMLAVVVLWLFNYFNWVVFDAITLSFLLVLAVAYRFKADKRGTG